ncbi:MAG: NADH-quinone oxidoreductase subunit J [Planctomycetes bacterium]|nr:NADH-quinone oxidoreductase subunit J [Planctomycetota bacterium]
MSTPTAYLLYAVFALGGVGLYFLLPRGRDTRTGAGAIFGLGALAALLLVLAARSVAGSAQAASFYLFSALAIGAATRVITHRKPVYSAIYFVAVVVSVAALLVLQRAEFLAVALIIIYAGAILVTYLFVIMLAQQSGEPSYDVRAREPLLAVVAGFLLMATVAVRGSEIPDAPAPAPRKLAYLTGSGADRDAVRSPGEASPGARGAAPASNLRQGAPGAEVEESNTLALGAAVMTRYVVVVELAAVLLLISMIGAIGLSRKRVPAEGPRADHAPLGQVGKEVAPY